MIGPDPIEIKRNADRAVETAKLVSSPEFKANLNRAIEQHNYVSSPEFRRRLDELLAAYQRAPAGPSTAPGPQARVERPSEATPPPRQVEKLDDPFGLMEMDAEGVTRWLAGGHCEPGSPRWEQAKAVQVFKIAKESSSTTPVRSQPPAPEPTQRGWNRVNWGMVGAIAGIAAVIVAIIAILVTGGGGG